MDRLDRWGIAIDTTNPDSIIATYHGKTVAVPHTPDNPQRAALAAAFHALQVGAFQREEPPTLREQRRAKWLRFVMKIAEYDAHIKAIEARYPVILVAPLVVRREYAALKEKFDRFPALRDEADAEIQANGDS